MATPNKEDQLLSLLETGNVDVFFDPKRPGVEFPKYFQDPIHITIGPNLKVPIPDLTVDADGICVTLSFSRSPYLCIIPWHAVFALRDEKGQMYVWEEDAPREANPVYWQERFGAMKALHDRLPYPPSFLYLSKGMADRVSDAILPLFPLFDFRKAVVRKTPGEFLALYINEPAVNESLVS